MPEATEKTVERLDGRGYAAQEHHAQALRPKILHVRRSVHARSLRSDPPPPANKSPGSAAENAPIVRRAIETFLTSGPGKATFAGADR